MERTKQIHETTRRHTKKRRNTAGAVRVRLAFIVVLLTFLPDFSRAEIPWADVEGKLREHRVIAMAHTPVGLWVGTHRGILRFDLDGRMQVKSELEAGNSIRRPSCFAALGPAVYAATELGLLRFQAPDTWELKQPPAAPVTLCVDGGQLLAGTEDGLYALEDWDSGKFASLGQIDADLLLEPRYFILSILPQPDAWLVGTNHGLGRIDRKTGKGRFLFKKHNAGLQTAAVNQIFLEGAALLGPGTEKTSPDATRGELALCTSMGLGRHAHRADAWRLLEFRELRTERMSAEDTELEAEMKGNAQESAEDVTALPGTKPSSQKPSKSSETTRPLPPSSNWLWCAAEFQGYLVIGCRAGLWIRHPKEELWRFVTPADKRLAGSWVTALLPLDDHLLIGHDKGLDIWQVTDLKSLFER